MPTFGVVERQQLDRFCPKLLPHPDAVKRPALGDPNDVRSPLPSGVRPSAFGSALCGPTHSGESTRGSTIPALGRCAAILCTDKSSRAPLRSDVPDTSPEPRSVRRVVLGGSRRVALGPN